MKKYISLSVIVFLANLSSTSVLAKTDGDVVVDAKNIDPISVVDDGFTKTVEFYFQSTNYSSSISLPKSDPNEVLALDILTIGNAVNYLGNFQISNRFRLPGVINPTACPSGPPAELTLHAAFTMANQLGSLTFTDNGETWCVSSGIPDLVLQGTGKGRWSCVTQAEFIWTRSDDVPVPLGSEPVGKPGFFEHSHVNPLNPAPDENKIIIRLTGPSDCPF